MSDIIHESFIMSLSTTWPLISIERLKVVFEDHEPELPDTCFVREIMEDLEGAEDDVNPCTRCSTANDEDAKFCKECGVALKQEEEKTTLADLNWSGDNAAETFDSIFVKKIAPFIIGRIEGGFLYGDPDDQNTPWQSAHFVIENGQFTYVLLDMERITTPPVFELDEDGE